MASPGHNSVLHLPGTDEWYIIYHAHKGDIKRRVFINRMEFDEKGQIKKIQPDLQGVPVRPIYLKLNLEKAGPYKTGETITLEATTNWKKGKVKVVEFYAGDNKIGEADKPPYRLEWKNVPKGFYQIYAKATHSSGEVAVSSPWHLDVHDQIE